MPRAPRRNQSEDRGSLPSVESAVTAQKEVRRDTRDNIFSEIVEAMLLCINPDLRPADVPGLLGEKYLGLQNEDLGCAFHKRLTARSGARLIDFDNLANNSFHAVAAPRRVDT